MPDGRCFRKGASSAIQSYIREQDGLIPTALQKIVDDIRQRPGIIEVLVEIREGKLYPGEDVMFVVVAGDFRENVFSALMDAVNRIKADVTRKIEI